eukprot:TRINITY_DN3704_c0_g1_i6.p1 TRINITY_DN3704_c0_g1~~TRINITY_DN3704_c0_g1_i6.p1  ORF type:complete len:123 (-),score=26.00 TRINITY_DN3704_c0_g1_i6:86-454(-)
MRFFRHYIRDWIKENKVGSYMWRKYSPRDPTMMDICFRGAEYLEDLTEQQANYPRHPPVLPTHSENVIHGVVHTTNFQDPSKTEQGSSLSGQVKKKVEPTKTEQGKSVAGEVKKKVKEFSVE